MKYTTSILGAVALSATQIAAFPAALFDKLNVPADQRDLAKVAEAIKSRAVGFNPALQYVSNKGQYAFVAPNLAAGDQRGPCPGLNAMANHGYIPHNGVATISQFIQGTYDVFGMGKDLGGFLSNFGALFDGDLAEWSIGGPSANVKSLLGSTPQGISGSHNKYEADASPVRGDLYQYGNAYKVQLKQFQQLFDTQPNPATANYDLDVLTDFRNTRFHQSIANNPYFFNGVFSGVLVQPAAYTFIFRFMGNKSAEYPEGRLNQDVLKSFFSITGKSGSFKYTEGYERIPDNWYKRAIGDEYTIPFFLTDVLAAAAKYPIFTSVGGNTGTTNSYTAIDIADLTGGVFNGATLLQGNNLACFVEQGVIQAGPDFTQIPADNLQLLFANAFPDFTCPKLIKWERSQFNKYPGSNVPDAVDGQPGVAS